MRKNTLLTTAISSALLVPLTGLAQTTSFEQFVNVGEGISTNATYNLQGAAQPLFESGNSPAYRFDQTTAVKVANDSTASSPNEIPNVTQGTPFANILFGGTVAIPTEVTTGTGGYLAALYTIDGDIVQDFELKVSLDNGAQFADKPLVGVRDMQNPDVTVVSFSAGTSTMVIDRTGAITTGTLFKFATDTNTYVLSNIATITATDVVATVQFWRLGGKPEAVAALPSGVVAGTTKLTIQAKNPVAFPYNPLVGTLAGVLTSFANTLTMVITSPKTDFLVAGWAYTCSGGYADIDMPIFKAKSVAKGTAAEMVVVVEPGIAPSTMGTHGTCANQNSIYRVHVAGDTIIHVSDVKGYAGITGTAQTLNNIFTGDAKPYKFSGFVTVGTVLNKVNAYNVVDYYGGTVIYPNDNPTFTAVAGTGALANTITISKPLVCALAGYSKEAGFNWGETIFDTNIEGDAEWNTTTVSPWPAAVLGAGNTTATFTMPAGKTSPNLNLKTYDQIALFYRLTNLGALAEPGSKVNMTAKLSTGAPIDKLVNPERTITVARSVEALKVDVTPTTGDVKISINASEKEFTGEAADGNDAFGDQNRAYIGYVTVSSPEDGYLQDATNPFSFDKAAASQSKFTITGGQFQASAVSPGQVAIEGVNGAINADQLTIDGDGFWTATWSLDSTDLQAIMDKGEPGAKILMQVDGTNTINSVENPPVGVLEVNFDDTFMLDLITEEKDLKRITKDGSVCTIYNVPPPTGGVIGADVLNLRITNDSAAAGSVTGDLYDENGGELKLGIPLIETLEKGQTAHLTSDKIAELAGITTPWTGRGIMRVRTTISQVEMLAMLRQQGIPAAPLSNVSVGADGQACSSN